MSINQFKRHKKAKATLKQAFDNATKVSAIHYSCESFYDRTDGSSPRVTSIAVRNLESGQTISFSIHQRAELRGLSALKDDIEPLYDELEKEMLDSFAEYLSRHTNQTWLHWNMRDQNYGFQAIEHRHRVLKGEPHSVPDDRKVDLSRLLISMYGVNYIQHPRLEKLLELNDIKAKDFLSGAEEACAFEERRYVDLHRSTLRKVDVLSNIAQRAYDGKLKTDSTWGQSHGMSMESLLAIVQEHPVYIFFVVLATAGGVLGLVQFLL